MDTKNNLRSRIYKIVPSYSLFPLVGVILYNSAVYIGARWIAKDFYHYNLETSFDKAMPLLPWTLIIYWGCYLFWIFNYILVARMNKNHAYRFFLAEVIAKTVCFLCFIFFPTTNVRPVIPDTGIFNRGMQLLYQIDAADNLFPSIHCLVSWFCYIGIKNQKNIPKWYKGFSMGIAIAVFVSTLTTKQHVIVDVIAAVILAEVCYFITGFIFKEKVES